MHLNNFRRGLEKGKKKSVCISSRNVKVEARPWISLRTASPCWRHCWCRGKKSWTTVPKRHVCDSFNKFPFLKTHRWPSLFLFLSPLHTHTQLTCSSTTLHSNGKWTPLLFIQESTAASSLAYTNVQVHHFITASVYKGLNLSGPWMFIPPKG